MQAEFPDGSRDIEPYDSEKLEAHLDDGVTEV